MYIFTRRWSPRMGVSRCDICLFPATVSPPGNNRNEPPPPPPVHIHPPPRWAPGRFNFSSRPIGSERTNPASRSDVTISREPREPIQAGQAPPGGSGRMFFFPTAMGTGRCGWIRYECCFCAIFLKRASPTPWAAAARKFHRTANWRAVYWCG